MLTFGSDPEFMIVDGKGHLVSAVDIVLGNDENRIHIDGHAFYHDNVLAECAVKPASGKENVIESFRECLKLYTEMVKPYRLVVRASATYPDDQLRSMAARTVGCHPESCGYELDFLPKQTEAIETTGFRSAGGHVHVGTDNEVWLREDTAHYGPKMFDLFLGIPSVFLDKDPTSKARRGIYGLAGSHRRKPYGCEYRTLSNFWLGSPRLVGLVYDLTEFIEEFVAEMRYMELWTENAEAISNYQAVEECYKCQGYEVEKLRAAINTGDKRKAKTFLTNVASQYLPDHLMKAIAAEVKAPIANDLYKEWSL